jgi:membrane-bound metal-dependent hydrolase YbcI (DUF457 family)
MSRRHVVAQAIRNKAYTYHMVIHVLLGLVCAFIVMRAFPSANIYKIISIGILGSLIPDVDHLLYMFLYGRKSEYSKILKAFVKDKEFRKALHFVKDNHKNNTGIYSHNILSLILSIYLAWKLGDSRDSAGFFVFFMSWSVHYVFDMFEDVLFLKRINPNWFMRFNRVPKKSDDQKDM